ncbi:hypothetical protein SAMN05421770_10370 [Granulicella rosea]|uniref:Outer membrane protein beta-barrel domain-containing protein n=1 Tax=Granulicella rosea TaxID=474952 RepID=A0A239IE71_9BACT|nr:hypothetical protein [Granulicella rosea]SNS91855.1 hypothetical protein SAMN05421770_10370 [Granulicella rosea]
MRLFTLTAALFLLPAANAAHAQFAVYGTFSPLHGSNVLTGSLLNQAGTSSAYTVAPQYTSFWASGFGGGVTYNFVPVGPVKLGVDLRGSSRPRTVGADTAMAGLKIAFKAPFIRFKPYAEVAGGYVATRTFNNSNYIVTSSSTSTSTVSFNPTYGNQYAAWEVLGGVDYALAPFVDLRLIEVGGGNGYSVGNPSSSGSLLSSSSNRIGVFTLNTGVVVHF